MRQPTQKPPTEPGIYAVTWRFANSETVHQGTAKWTGEIWIAQDTPGGAIVLSCEGQVVVRS